MKLGPYELGPGGRLIISIIVVVLALLWVGTSGMSEANPYLPTPTPAYYAYLPIIANRWPAPNLSFTITADVRDFADSDPRHFRGACEAIANLTWPTKFMVSPGDIDPPQDMLYVITDTLGTGWYPGMGNHERPGEGNEDRNGENLEWLQAGVYDVAPTNLLRNGDFEMAWGEDKSHRCLVFPDGYETDIENIFTPTGWTTWFHHNPGVWDQPEVRETFIDDRVHEGEAGTMLFTVWRNHDAGFVQQVEVEPGTMLRLTAWAHAWSNSNEGLHPDDPYWSEGAGYRVIAWLKDTVGLDPEDENFLFSIGIDPTGGTDPYASTVEWGPAHHIYNGYARELHATATAQASTVTVFLRSTTSLPFKHNDAYWDSVELVAVERESNPGPSGCPDTTWSVDKGDVHIVMLNQYCNEHGPYSAPGSISDHLYEWLEQDLATTDKPYTLVFGHEPVWKCTDIEWGECYPGEPNLLGGQRLWDLLVAENATAYISGHTHLHSIINVDGVYQIDVGHARGEDPYSGARSTFVVVLVYDTHLQIEVYRDDGHGEDYVLIDTIVVGEQ